MGVERWIHILGQDDGSIQPFPQPRYAVRRGFDVEVQIGMLAPQFAHARKQPLPGKKGQHAEPKAKLVAILLHLLDRHCQDRKSVVGTEGVSTCRSRWSPAP